MPSLEERERGGPECCAMAAHMGTTCSWHSSAQADHSREQDALAERLKVLKGEYDKRIQVKTRQLGFNPETQLRMAACRLGMTEDPVRDPIYKDDLPHR